MGPDKTLDVQQSQTKRRRSRFDRALAVTLISGLALLLVLGVVYSIANGSQRITTHATALHKADESLRSATIVRAQLALAVHMASVDRALGTNSAAEIALSFSEAETALSDLEGGIAELTADETVTNSIIPTAADGFLATGDKIIDLVDVGEVDAAQILSKDTLGPQFEVLVAELVLLRDQLAARVEASDVLLGRVGNIARFLVAFLIPAAVMFLYRDLLRRQQRQSELESRLEAERHFSRAREEFIANASHELRTPLTAISGLALMLTEDPALTESESGRELVDLIVGESDDLSRMVEDLLTTARLDAGALHFTFENVAVSEAALDVAGPMIRARAAITVDCVAGLVRADRLRLRQVLRNLLSNARKYGGPNIAIEGRIAGRTYVCSVIDDGDGIPDEVVGRFFQRFVHHGKSNSVTESVGLGLSIVKSLAESMGGSISYKRTRNRTHFVLHLPLVIEQPDLPQPHVPDSARAAIEPDLSGSHR